MANNRYNSHGSGYNPYNSSYNPYSSANISYNEIYDPSQNTMPFRMDAEEIPVQRQYQEYYNQVPQFFYNENHHHHNGYRDYDRNERSERGNYVPEQTPFAMDTEELQIEARTQSANYLINDGRNVLTVPGTPRNPRNGRTEFRNHVRDYDNIARLTRRR